MVRITRGVSLQLAVHLLAHLAAHVGQVVHVGGEHALLLAAQTVEAHILLRTVGPRIVEGIHQACSRRHAAPLRLRVGARHLRYGHTVLVEFLAVLQHILRHLTQVDVEVTAARLGVVDEGVQHPELDVLDVRTLEVRRRQLSHDTAPALLRIGQLALGSQVRVQIVGTTLVGVVGQVQHRECRRLSVGTLLIRIQFAFVHLAHVMVRQLVQVTLDMCRRQRRVASGKERVNRKPVEQCAVHARAGIVHQVCIGL